MVAAEAEARQIVCYRSDDLRNWDYLSAFGPVGDTESLWECPDLFALPIDGDPDRLGWVLVVSLNPDLAGNGSATRYFVGEFDGVTFMAAPHEFRRLDWGRDLYAAVSFDNEPTGRRILLGWLSNWDYAASVPTSPWRGSMSLPRELALVTIDGVVTLIQRPVAELSTLDVVADGHRSEPFELVGTRVFQAPQRFRLDVTFDSIDAAELGVDLLVGDGHATRIRYDTGTKRLSVDRTRSGDTEFHPTFASIESATVPLRDGALRLEVFVDRGSVEVFAQHGEVCCTEQVFAPDNTGFAIGSFGGSARVAHLQWLPLGSAHDGDRC
jgi:sucrose-6-phosphate hydrolase SacC (GH32 family)